MDFVDLEKYGDEYNNVSRIELGKIRYCSQTQMVFESKVRSLHVNRENEKNNGRPALKPGPLVHLLSVSIQPEKDDDKLFAIYGRIHVEYSDSIYGGTVGYDLYKRERNAAEILNKGDTLTLNGPDYSCQPKNAFMPMFRSKINVGLFDGQDNVFARGCFSLDDCENEGGYEQVKTVSFCCEQGSLIVKYVAIPFGIYCRIEIMFYNRHDSKKHDFIDVNGKVVARCVNTYGNYFSEECVLFDQQANECERVQVDQLKMQLSRCWVALPAYSSLVVGVNLSEFQTGRKIVNDIIELVPRQGLMSGDSFVLDDMFIQVRVAWFSPTPLRPQEDDFIQPEKDPVNVFSSLSPTQQGTQEEDNEMELEDKSSTRTQEMPTEEIEDMDTEGEDEASSDDHSESSSSLNIPWGLHPHKSKPWPSPAVEIFSVFIGREKSKELQIHGSIEILSGDRCYIFKRDEKDALWLSEHVNSIPILDGSRVYEDCSPLEMKFDLKDVDGSLAIKGYVNWDASVLDNSFYRDKQICSFIQGRNGFAAVHYSIFSDAVAANIKVFLSMKTVSADICPKVYGSLISEYRYYDYSSRYNKDYYRCVLFMRTQDGSIQLNDDGSIPLSRSLVVVPSFSSLIVNIDLSTGVSGQKLSCAEEIGIGDRRKTIETSDCVLRVEVDWCEIK